MYYFYYPLIVPPKESEGGGGVCDAEQNKDLKRKREEARCFLLVRS
jgi:hypothetical protein